MQRKSKTKSKENQKSKFASRKKEINEKTKSRTFFSCHISQHFDKRKYSLLENKLRQI